MDEIVANVDNIVFEIEVALDRQIGALPLPFPGMDKSGAAVCTYFESGLCSMGAQCPFRHVKGDRSVVCKHWLRGLCKKGDQCEFLHEYDMTKMPECYFYSRFNACSNKECPFLHIDPESKIKDCPWYDRGFCRHGPTCRHRHTRRVMCVNYLCGFCPQGPDCKFVHPTFELPGPEQMQQLKKQNIVCHFCQEPGHKITNCPNMSQEQREKNASERQNIQNTFREPAPAPRERPPKTERNFRPLDEVTCYKCGERGHYANRCPKGHLAFLSSALQTTQP